MSPDESALREKLADLLRYIAELEPHTTVTLDEYLASPLLRRAVERLIQITMEVTTDIADVALTELGQEPPAAARESLAKLRELKILSPALADRLIQFVGVRNRLVRQYDRIDDSRVHAGLRSFLRRPWCIPKGAGRLPRNGSRPAPLCNPLPAAGRRLGVGLSIWRSASV
jgi:uncharacterized protein YutE (UPF0331/DUF86 family)